MDANVQSQANGSAMAELIARLQAENAALKAKAEARLTHGFKVSEKGAVSIYGFGKFSITLYRSQIERLTKIWPELLAFVEAHAGQLKSKD